MVPWCQCPDQCPQNLKELAFTGVLRNMRCLGSLCLWICGEAGSSVPSRKSTLTFTVLRLQLWQWEKGIERLCRLKQIDGKRNEDGWWMIDTYQFVSCNNVVALLWAEYEVVWLGLCNTFKLLSGTGHWHLLHLPFDLSIITESIDDPNQELNCKQTSSIDTGTLQWKIEIPVRKVLKRLWRDKLQDLTKLVERCQPFLLLPSFGYGSMPINTIFSGMNIHLPAILMFTRGTRFWHTAIWDVHLRCSSSIIKPFCQGGFNW